jgi:lantibiotic modifying enzyme
LSIPIGDFHNFGKRVAPDLFRAQPMFFKPRTVFWEKIFFGHDSPIKEMFNWSIHYQDKSLIFANANFNLQIFSESNEQTGWSREIEQKINPDFPYDLNLGALLAYSLTLGIFDLHLQNLKITQSGIQVIDCEVVLGQMILPHETLLLPFKNFPADETIAKYLVPNQDLLKLDPTSILIGFHQMMNHLISKSTDLKQELMTVEKTKHPIRIILRDSRKYLKLIPNDYDTKPLIREEMIQIEREDIPYFYTFLDNKNLYYFTTSAGDSAIVKLPDYFLKDMERMAKSPDFLLNQPRLETLQSTGLLFLANFLFRDQSDFKISDGGIEIHGTQDKIELSLKLKMVSTKRVR